MINWLKSIFIKALSTQREVNILKESVVIACYYNPKGNPYRKLAFDQWFNSIKHYNYRIIECGINTNTRELPTNDPNISFITTNSLLWHKESLLNKIVEELPSRFKYIFWSDTDILHSNPRWLEEAATTLKESYVKVIQPFEKAIHLYKDQSIEEVNEFNPVYESFGYAHTKGYSHSSDYSTHGHVGFLWGIRRYILDEVGGLYDKALIGGADHIMAHAAAGHINHECITKAYKSTIGDINKWSLAFMKHVRGQIGYTRGTVHHIWHGDLDKRQYLKRIVEADAGISTLQHKDQNGLYINTNSTLDMYLHNYLDTRESTENIYKQCTINECFS